MIIANKTQINLIWNIHNQDTRYRTRRSKKN